MPALMYRYPPLYELALRTVHGKQLRRRYEIIAEKIGENKRVFEPGCGTAMIYPFLPRGCVYEGWDLNARFLAYCRKRGVTVFNRDIFDVANYPESDVILICDVLHHVIPRHESLVVEALKRTKTLIISEPAKSFKPSAFLMPIAALLNYFILDYDGINSAKTQLEWDYSKDKLKAFFQRLGCTETIDVGWDMIAVFNS
jgi:SAM-dependent methyltransferase